MDQVDVDEVQKLRVQLERDLETAFITDHLCDTGSNLATLDVAHERQLIQSYEGNQEHLPHPD